MPHQILFLPDTELLISGRSGAERILRPVQATARELIESALTETSAQSVGVFAAKNSKFGRPLPGHWVGQQLLEAAQFTGDIHHGEEDAVLPDCQLWLLMGTGAASHGENAPLVSDDRAPEVDAAIAEALRQSDWHDLLKIDSEAAEAVGATLIAGIHRAARLGNLTAISPDNVFKCADMLEHFEFGVTYFLARWVAEREEVR